MLTTPRQFALRSTRPQVWYTGLVRHNADYPTAARAAVDTTSTLFSTTELKWTHDTDIQIWERGELKLHFHPPAGGYCVR